jgi:ubiquinone/menaquinone biosynthesis C-methylase UbiE
MIDLWKLFKPCRQHRPPISAPTIKFDDGAAYERMMGTWSGLIGAAFVDWLSPPPNLRWVDIGCGNGAFTKLLIERCAPMAVEGVDPSEGQLAFARERLATPVAKFRQGDAMALPFADGSFDAAVMALVVFFIPDPVRGVAEMARVVRPGGLAAAYVWDIVNGGGPSEGIIGQMKEMGCTPPRAPKAEASTSPGLQALWARAGFVDIEAQVVHTRRTFDDFEDYWFTTIAAPNLAPMLKTMATADVTELKSRVREQVLIEASGRVSIEARANAILGRRPG